MAVNFFPVTTEEEITYLANLAYDIWQEYWPERIGQAQTDYMVELFQSEDAITRDMAENNYEYWLICVDDEEAAFATAPTDAQVDASVGASTAPAAAKNSAPVPYPSNIKGRIVGFTGGHVEPETNRFFISKVYLLAEERGRGYASKTIAFYNDLCKSRGLRAMYLTVNKDNDLGIRAYEGKGFITIDATETDIGGGFIMDDYIMEKVAK